MTEVAVAAAEGQAVGFADGRAGDDLDGEVERFDHRLEIAELLEIFHAEAGDLWLNNVKELGDDLADAFKVPGAMPAFKDGRELRQIDGDLRTAGGVHLGRGGVKDRVHAGLLAEGQVILDRAGVSPEILVRPELRRG